MKLLSKEVKLRSVKRIVVAGSRAKNGPISDSVVYYVLCELVDAFGINPECVIHGAEPTGVDAIADRWARDMGIPVERVPADWTRYGISAGPIRNTEMACDRNADMLIAFRSATGESPGTDDMVKKSAPRMPVLLVRVASDQSFDAIWMMNENQSN